VVLKLGMNFIPVEGTDAVNFIPTIIPLWKQCEFLTWRNTSAIVCVLADDPQMIHDNRSLSSVRGIFVTCKM
jgi:hypothetical protein